MSATAGGPFDRELGCAIALASLPDITPHRLAALLHERAPSEAWAMVGRLGVPPGVHEGRVGRPHGDLGAQWRAAAASLDPGELRRRHRAAGVAVLVRGLTAWPDELAAVDPPAPVLFALGDLHALDARRVGLVGTRRATALGRDIARLFGTELAAAGVAVVSGLAWGVDAAAHRGALGAGGAAPVAVVGCGLDVPYPKANAELWQAVAGVGLVLGEHPLGVRPHPHHFPLRNRILAALSELIVVVESHARGGALITADVALALGRGVGAVPGSLRNPAAAGANALLRDGAIPIIDGRDILVALGLVSGRAEPGEPVGLEPFEQLVLDEMGDGGTVDQLVARTNGRLDQVVAARDELDERGLVAPDGPHWTRTVRSKAW